VPDWPKSTASTSLLAIEPRILEGLWEDRGNKDKGEHNGDSKEGSG